MSLVFLLRPSNLFQIYKPQKIINYAWVKKRGRLQRSNEKVRCNFAPKIRYEEFSKECTVSDDHPAESRPAADRAGRDYYFSHRKEGQHLMASAETVINFCKGHQQKLMAFVISAQSLWPWVP